VAYYSHSGNTERVAAALAAELGADLEAVVDRRGRRGLLGYLRAGRDAVRGRDTEIEPPTALAVREQELKTGDWEGRARGFAAEIAAIALGRARPAEDG